MSFTATSITGKAPTIKAKQVNPKAKPGRPGNIFEIVTSVIGIVILNKNIPKIANSGVFAPKTIKGIDKTRAPTPTQIQPNLSAKIPPSPLPNTIANVRTKAKSKFIFQGKETNDPTRDRIVMDKNTNSKIRAK